MFLTDNEMSKIWIVLFSWKKKKTRKKEGVAGKWINNRIWFNNVYDIMSIVHWIKKSFRFLIFESGQKLRAGIVVPLFGECLRTFMGGILIWALTYSNEFILGTYRILF